MCDVVDREVRDVAERAHAHVLERLWCREVSERNGALGGPVATPKLRAVLVRHERNAGAGGKHVVGKFQQPHASSSGRSSVRHPECPALGAID